MKKKLVILGDSLSMPRINDGVLYEDSYPSILANSIDFEVINRSRRANDTNEQLKLQNSFDDVTSIKPDIVVLHLGIVDCSPRLFSRLGNKVINKLKYINKYIIKIMSKNRFFFTKLFKKVYVNIDKYKSNMEQIIDFLKENNVEHIFIINICSTNKENSLRSFNFEKNIEDYNNVIDEVAKKTRVTIIDMRKYTPEEILIQDGIHLNKNGNKIIADSIIKRI